MRNVFCVELPNGNCHVVQDPKANPRRQLSIAGNLIAQIPGCSLEDKVWESLRSIGSHAQDTVCNGMRYSAKPIIGAGPRDVRFVVESLNADLEVLEWIRMTAVQPDVEHLYEGFLAIRAASDEPMGEATPACSRRRPSLRDESPATLQDLT